MGEHYITNNAVLIKVTGTSPNEIAIHAGDTFHCNKCNGKYVFTTNIKGGDKRSAKLALAHAHALDCTAKSNDVKSSGLNRAIRDCLVQVRKTKGKQRVYDGYRYRVTVLTDNSFSITDKTSNVVYGAYYQGSKLVLLRA